jgi:hypothetical protein
LGIFPVLLEIPYLLLHQFLVQPVLPKQIIFQIVELLLQLPIFLNVGVELGLQARDGLFGILLVALELLF